MASDSDLWDNLQVAPSVRKFYGMCVFCIKFDRFVMSLTVCSLLFQGQSGFPHIFHLQIWYKYWTNLIFIWNYSTYHLRHNIYWKLNWSTADACRYWYTVATLRTYKYNTNLYAYVSKSVEPNLNESWFYGTIYHVLYWPPCKGELSCHCRSARTLSPYCHPSQVYQQTATIQH